jgi:elongation factor Ts
VLVTLLASSEDTAKDSAFSELGEDLAMQIAAMNPSAVSPDRLVPDEIERQKTIFETQLTELNKPLAAWPKILDGKFNKWYSEVCLLNQESVVQPKTTVGQVVKNVGTKLGGDIQVVNFIRCQVGEGLEKKQDDLASEVAKLM